MTSAIIHIGAGKCGSSAIQAALSHNPSLGNTRKVIEYVAIASDGKLIHGENLSRSVRHNIYGYLSSASVPKLADLSPIRIKKLSEELATVAGKKGTVILSNEGWLNLAARFQQEGLLSRLKLDATVVVYVRPPVDWLNSAWWQWGAWTGAPLQRWINNNIDKVCWHDRILPWKDVEGVEKIVVRLLPKDIVGDFCQLVGIDKINTRRSNTSMSGTLLRLFQKNRQLRPDAHSSMIDFVLARHLQVAKEPTPWVLGPGLVKRILAETEENSLKLMEMLDKDSRIEMQADRRWWDASVYENKEHEPANLKRIKLDKLEALTVEALQAVYELDKENRQLKERLEYSSDSDK